MEEGRIPVGATIVIPNPVTPAGKVGLAGVSNIRATEGIVQSIPYGPGARPDSPRLYGGASFGG